MIDREIQKRDAVAQLVRHPRVRSGEWKSPYDLYQWQPADNMPANLQSAIRMAEMVLHPAYDWKAEAFFVKDDEPPQISVRLAMKSSGCAPLKASIFKAPTLKLKEVISPPLARFLEKSSIRVRYRDFWEMDFPQIFFFEPEGGIQKDNSFLSLPGFSRIDIKPFWFFQGDDEKEKAVAEDPFRLVFNVLGASLGHTYWFLKKQGVSIEQMKSVFVTIPYPSEIKATSTRV